MTQYAVPQSVAEWSTRIFDRRDAGVGAAIIAATAMVIFLDALGEEQWLRASGGWCGPLSPVR